SYCGARQEIIGAIETQYCGSVFEDRLCSAGHARATANLKLTFHLGHSAGADQSCTSRSASVGSRRICSGQELPTADIPAIMMKEGCWRPGEPRSIETCEVGSRDLIDRQ